MYGPPVRVYINFMGLGNSLYYRSIGFGFSCRISEVLETKSSVRYHYFFFGKDIPVPGRQQDIIARLR